MGHGILVVVNGLLHIAVLHLDGRSRRWSRGQRSMDTPTYMVCPCKAMRGAAGGMLLNGKVVLPERWWTYEDCWVITDSLKINPN